MTSLTAQQLKIAELASLGVSNGTIAAQLGLTAAVVTSELSQIYQHFHDDAFSDGAEPRGEDSP